MNRVVRPPAWKLLEVALRRRQPVAVTYHGLERVVCPHALGWKNARPMLLGYQVGGQTSHGALDADPNRRWRLMFIDEIDGVDIDCTPASWATGANYDHGRPFPALTEVCVSV